MTTTRYASWTCWFICALMLAGCASGPVRRVSDPSARIQQLTVRADGSWAVDLRIENFSSIPMRFQSLQLALTINEHAAGDLRTQPRLSIGPESADVVSLTMTPLAAGKLAVAEALASGRSIEYALEGTLSATPQDSRQREFEMEFHSALSPAPGLPGVLR